MDTKQLATFLTLAQQGNYLRAADCLNYAPSTLAKHIHCLETELQSKLVERRGNRILLTPEGEKFYGYAQRMQETYLETMAAFLDLDRLEGSIHIAGGEPIVGFSLSGLFLQYSSQHPEVSLNVQMTCCARVPAWIRSREIDMGYIHEMQVVDNASYQSIPLYNEPVCLLAASQHPLAQEKEIGYQDLTGQKFAFTYDNCCFTMAFRERMRREGIAVHSELFLGSMSAVLQSVCNDGRIALVPYTTFLRLQDQRLVCLPWKGEPLRVWLQILYERARNLSLAERKMIDVSRQFAGELMKHNKEVCYI